MAAIPVVLNGTFTSDAGSVVGNFQGTMAYSDRAPGGGPIEPPSIWPSPGHPAHPIAPGGPPPGIWGPNDPRPTPPIQLPPYEPGGPPVGIWPSPGHPEHPIVLPEPPPPPSGGVKPPPPDGGWGYHPDYGWGYFPGPGEAGPKAA